MSGAAIMNEVLIRAGLQTRVTSTSSVQEDLKAIALELHNLRTAERLSPQETIRDLRQEIASLQRQLSSAISEKSRLQWPDTTGS